MIRKIPSPFLAVLMLGTVSQIGQILFLREFLMVFHGNELSIGLILAAWLAWVGAGSRLGVALVGRSNRPRFLLALSAVGILIALPLTILFIRGLRAFFPVLPGAYLSLLDMAISCFLLMAPVCLLLGVQFVLLSKVWRESSQAVDTTSAGKTYIGEAAGNALSGMLFALLMVHYLNSFQSAVFAGLFMLSAILYMTRNSRTDTEHVPVRLRPALLGLSALAALSLPLLGYADDWAYQRKWRHFSPQHRLVETYQSKYGTISVLEREGQYSFFQSGHLIFSTAGPRKDAPGLEEQEAVSFAHFAMVQHEKPERLLLIGGGLRGVLREIAKHPVKRIDYIELDEVLTDVARPYVSPATLEVLADPRVRIIHTDGRLFAKTSKETYDLIIVDVPDPSTAVLNRFYTREFFREAKDLLAPDGVFVIAVTSTPDLRGTAIANRNATIYHTLRSVFSRVLPAGERVLFFFATNAPEQISLDVQVLQERYRERQIETEGFSANHFHLLLLEAQLRRVNWVVRNHGRSADAHLRGPGSVPLFPVPLDEQERTEKELPPVEQRYFINSDFRPIGYFYTLMFWEDLTRAGRGEIFEWLLHVKAWWLLPLLGLPLLVALKLRMAARRGGKRADTHFAVLCLVFMTGLSAMVLQIALLSSFQSIFGFIYETVGLIMAFFMCGLALGASFTNRYGADKATIKILAGVQLLSALWAGLMALVLPGAAAVPSPAMVFVLFSALTLATGLVNGINFPLSAACYLTLSRQAEKSAGTAYGVELLGACIGAVLASVVLVPIFGIMASCLFAGMANGSALIVLLISRRADLCLT
ncbi:MAG: fused MFS/spermidine synthase [Firmicutes bacterium]|nr:fused MFS/spermidine synthase [Bacillota bacterium]